VLHEAGDVIHETAGGIWDTSGELLDGDFGGAWDEVRETGGEVLSDGVDGVVNRMGDAVETGHDVYDAGRDFVEDVGGGLGSAFDNTLGRIF
jgi:hypothetical protein